MLRHRPYISEAIGAFALALTVSLSASGHSISLPAPFLAGITLGLFVYMIGSISGSHLNPAVTIALFSAKKISARDARSYVCAQLIGGLCALIISSLIIQKPLAETFSGAFQHLGSGFDSHLLPMVLSEALGTFFLLFGILSVVMKKVPADAAGIVVGGSLFLGETFAGPVSGGVLNPAVALAVGNLNVIYVVGPVLGGLLGAWVGRKVFA